MTTRIPAIFGSIEAVFENVQPLKLLRSQPFHAQEIFSPTPLSLLPRTAMTGAMAQSIQHFWTNITRMQNRQNQSSNRQGAAVHVCRR